MTVTQLTCTLLFININIPDVILDYWEMDFFCCEHRGKISQNGRLLKCQQCSINRTTVSIKQCVGKTALYSWLNPGRRNIATNSPFTTCMLTKIVFYNLTPCAKFPVAEDMFFILIDYQHLTFRFLCISSLVMYLTGDYSWQSYGL